MGKHNCTKKNYVSKHTIIGMEGGRKMRTLAQIRSQNKSNNLLFVGMGEAPIQIPSEVKEKEQTIYNDFVKPTSRRVLARYLEKTKT